MPRTLLIMYALPVVNGHGFVIFIAFVFALIQLASAIPNAFFSAFSRTSVKRLSTYIQAHSVEVQEVPRRTLDALTRSLQQGCCKKDQQDLKVYEFT